MSDETGKWLFIPAEPHECSPPIPPMMQPQKPTGSVWKCNCGTVWYLDGFRIWTRAGFIIQWKFRNKKKED